MSESADLPDQHNYPETELGIIYSIPVYQVSHLTQIEILYLFQIFWIILRKIKI